MSFFLNCRPTWVNTVLPELEEALPSLWVHTQSEGKHHKIHELLKKSRESVVLQRNSIVLASFSHKNIHSCTTPSPSVFDSSHYIKRFPNCYLWHKNE